MDKLVPNLIVPMREVIFLPILTLILDFRLSLGICARVTEFLDVGRLALGSPAPLLRRDTLLYDSYGSLE